MCTIAVYYPSINLQAKRSGGEEPGAFISALPEESEIPFLKCLIEAIVET